MSCSYRVCASIEAKAINHAERERKGVAVNSIAWLDMGLPSVYQSTNNKAADPAEHKNRNILVCDDGIGKADEQTKQKANQPSWPAR